MTTALSREALESCLGFRVIDFESYVTVFTHRSVSREHGTPSYERLEFIGDAVIGFIVAKYLYEKFPDEDEGFLTKVRTKMVSGQCLARIAHQLGLHRFIRMNAKAIASGWNHNPRILEDVFESLVACIFFDLGMATAKDFLLGLYDKYVDYDEILKDTNFKDGLMRYTQSLALDLPVYRVLNDPQITKIPSFDIVVEVGGFYGRGRDVSKKASEQTAAKNVLMHLGLLNACGSIKKI